MKILIINDLKNHKVEISVKNEITNYDVWLEEMEEFTYEELEDLGVYEFDAWDETKSIIQIPDEEEDWLENFNKIVEKVKNKVG